MAVEVKNEKDNNTWLEPQDEQKARAHIFSRKNKLAEVIVPIQEWEMSVLIRAMTGTQRYEYEALANHYAADEDKSKLYKNLSWMAVQMCCLHPKTKQPIFKPADQGNFLDEEGGALIDYLSGVVLAISKMDVASREAARKNLSTVLHSAAVNLQNV